MKTNNTADRLRQLMAERGLKQVDILRLAKPYCENLGVKMNKSDISQYVNGKVEPQQEKLFVLSAALNVSEGWLMGYAVPMRRIPDAERFAAFAEHFNATHPELPTIAEKEMSDTFKQLNDANQTKVLEYGKGLLAVQVAEEELLAAHQRTDTDGTDEDRKHDIDLLNGNN